MYDGMCFHYAIYYIKYFSGNVLRHHLCTTAMVCKVIALIHSVHWIFVSWVFMSIFTKEISSLLSSVPLHLDFCEYCLFFFLSWIITIGSLVCKNVICRTACIKPCLSIVYNWSTNNAPPCKTAHSEHRDLLSKWNMSGQVSSFRKVNFD